MGREEEIAERIVRQAFDDGGEVVFTDTELKGCTDRKLLQKVNLLLSLYGELTCVTTADRWGMFKMNEKGMRFIKQGGFKGEEERDRIRAELETLALENARLQKESSEYQKTIRHQNDVIRAKSYINALLWFVSIGIALAFIIFKR